MRAGMGHPSPYPLPQGERRKIGLLCTDFFLPPPRGRTEERGNAIIFPLSQRGMEFFNPCKKAPLSLPSPTMGRGKEIQRRQDAKKNLQRAVFQRLRFLEFVF
jgi:hypothetical protein